MFIPAHPSLSCDFVRGNISNANLFPPSSTPFREITGDYEPSNINSAKCAKNPGMNLNGVVSPQNKGQSCNANANANETGDVGLHGDTGGCAVLHAASLERRYHSRDPRGNQGGAPAPVAHADTRRAPRPDAPVTYVNHPTYGFLPASTRYLAMLAEWVR